LYHHNPIAGITHKNIDVPIPHSDFAFGVVGSNIIKKMVVRDAINAGIGIDDLEFGSVPEPAIMLLIGTGLLGLATVRPKMKK
jgi:hypothetical protein